ncbi:MAG: divalent-cation tolerance protein CutA [Rickettsiales bacterium]|nr:divalent-cation tolerance protein CutA [Rickettsiales bacterium]
MSNNFIFLYITFSSEQTAISLAKKCLEEKIIACANIIPNTIAIYDWQNIIQQNRETIAIFKTVKEKKNIATDFIKKNHEYSCPCIALLDVEILNNDFSNWIRDSIK